jgi:hypothetical protein
MATTSSVSPNSSQVAQRVIARLERLPAARLVRAIVWVQAGGRMACRVIGEPLHLKRGAGLTSGTSSIDESTIEQALDRARRTE